MREESEENEENCGKHSPTPLLYTIQEPLKIKNKIKEYEIGVKKKFGKKRISGKKTHTCKEKL